MPEFTLGIHTRKKPESNWPWYAQPQFVHVQ